jgi:hypothetical protein
VLTGVDDTAKAAEALHMLDIYDFKLYGQGLTAGGQALNWEEEASQVL